STTSGTTGWIPGLAPEFISVLPRDPKETSNKCYLYRSNGTDYTLLAYLTMETCVSDNCRDSNNPTSIQEMARRASDQPSIAVYSSNNSDN
ncbi:MAG: hypothetical protein WCV58_02310, partial [Patescibacteria group bacterium]